MFYYYLISFLLCVLFGMLIMEEVESRFELPRNYIIKLLSISTYLFLGLNLIAYVLGKLG